MGGLFRPRGILLRARDMGRLAIASQSFLLDWRTASVSLIGNTSLLGNILSRIIFGFARSLTKFVLYRPHGQHSVILAEDIPKYLEYTGAKTEPGGIIAGSRQIYLTFPAENNFTEQDVSNYFKWGCLRTVVELYLVSNNFWSLPFVLQQIWAGSRCANPMPAEEDVWVCHLSICRHSETYFVEREPSFCMRGSSSGETIQGEV